MKLFGYFARGLSSAALVIALLFGANAIPAAEANRQDGSVVALAYDSGTGTLLKAYAHALYRSADEGQSWQRIEIASLEDAEISTLAVSPAGKDVMYVAAGPRLGVLRTDDGGKTWIDRNEGLPSRDVIAVATHTTQPNTLYAVVKEHGFYRSQDAGKNWRLMERKSQEGLRQLIHSDLPGSMQTGWLFAATAKGVRRAMDCFCLWQDAGKLGSQAYGVTYDPREPKHVYAATENGLFRSSDGGENWVQLKSPSPNVVALAFARSGILFVINAKGDLYRSKDEGGTWKQMNA
jgi:photosystem II stability/assembly factor-like uncharacterized protein